MNLPDLNLPVFEYKVKHEELGTYIWDIIRKKYIYLTPEEWVRQHFVQMMVSHLGYPAGLFRIESGMKYHQKSKRTDIEVMATDGKIHMLVECKNPLIPIDQKTITQLSIYNKVINAKYLAITNGMKHFVWEKSKTNHDYLSIERFPAFKKE